MRHSVETAVMSTPVRDLAATAYSARRHHVRFGPEFEAFYRRLGDTQWLPRDQMSALQTARLQEILRVALSEVPFYASLAGSLGLELTDVSRDPWPVLREFPVLDKETVRSRGAELQSRRPVPTVRTHTSGTTGKALHLAVSRVSFQRSYACFWHHYSWFGVSLGARVATLGGHRVAASRRQRPPFWVTDWLGRERLFSSQHLMPSYARAYCDALCSFRPQVIRGYPSSLHSLATFALDQGLRLPQPAVVVTSSETLRTEQRTVIGEAFGAGVVSAYGSAERVAHVFECECGLHHSLPFAGVLEVLKDDGKPAEEGEEGELVCTGLLDTHMPLIRYRTGDRAVLGPASCACGRAGPCLRELTGRTDDVLLTPDGRRVGRLGHAFKDSLSIREAQIVQDAADTVTVKVVFREEPSMRELEKVGRELRFRLGPSMRIRFETVDMIPRDGNGKFHFVVGRRPLPERGDGMHSSAARTRYNT